MCTAFLFVLVPFSTSIQSEFLFRDELISSNQTGMSTAKFIFIVCCLFVACKWHSLFYSPFMHTFAMLSVCFLHVSADTKYTKFRKFSVTEIFIENTVTQMRFSCRKISSKKVDMTSTDAPIENLDRKGELLHSQSFWMKYKIKCYEKKVENCISFASA